MNDNNYDLNVIHVCGFGGMWFLDPCRRRCYAAAAELRNNIIFKKFARQIANDGLYALTLKPRRTTTQPYFLSKVFPRLMYSAHCSGVSHWKHEIPSMENLFLVMNTQQQ